MPYAILGLHEPMQLKLCTAFARNARWEVDGAGAYGPFRELLARRTPDLVIMDANLGNPGSFDITPARETFATLEERTRFVALTGSDRAVQACEREGIPARIKGPNTLGAYFETPNV